MLKFSYHRKKHQRKEGKNKMAISQESIKELERITSDLGDLLLTMRPVTIKEWDVFDGAVTAHKHLRKLDTDNLRQLELPLVKELP